MVVRRLCFTSILTRNDIVFGEAHVDSASSASKGGFPFLNNFWQQGPAGLQNGSIFRLVSDTASFSETIYWLALTDFMILHV